MKKIIFVFVALSFSFALAKNGRKISQEETAPQFSELKKKFFEQTKIEEGEYSLEAKSDESCASGPLAVMDVGESSKDELLVTLGASNLVENIGKEKYSEKEEDCTVTFESSYNDVAIKERVERECKDVKKSVFHTTVTLGKGKISYVKEIYEGEKLLETTKCNLKLAATIPKIEEEAPEVKVESKVKFKKLKNKK